MGRIALFVLGVGGLSYLAIGFVAGLTGHAPAQVLKLSLAVIIAVLAWTAFVWFAGDRLGRKDSARESEPTSEPTEGG